ncbi:hypothetical protein N0V88_004120 [Collariella sp. IMI 366227]|nr:hypothetical protein N0V88_004120 [Collariella sp. IMI 366227]
MHSSFHFRSTSRFVAGLTNHFPADSEKQLSQPVTSALATNKPVVALESTIYTHGALGNDLNLEAIVRAHGAVPAVCGILAGVPTVGLEPAEIERMVQEGAKKVSRRDLAYLSARSILGRREGAHGGTTIAGTMILARTLEFLETQGAFVTTFAGGKAEGEKVDFPAFWARESGTPSPSVVRDEREAAAIILAQEQLGVESGMLFANPIPEEYAIPRNVMEEAIARAVREAEEHGFTGNKNTPYVLQRIRELTDGKSVPANKALVQDNVARAAKIAVELAKLMDGNPVTPTTVKTTVTTKTTSSQTVNGAGQTSSPTVNVQSQVETTTQDVDSHPVDILVAGSVALDLNCDYTAGIAPGSGKTVSPALHTSNPSTISQSVGGVGHNIALAAHKISGNGKVRLCSMIGDDIAGSTILNHLQTSGLDTSFIRQLGHEYPSTRTAQYVAVNDAHKNLVMAMADMAIFSTHSFPSYWNSAVAASKPKWLAVDANWGEADIQTWIDAARKHGSRVAFEPVSTAKAQRLFPAIKRHSHTHTLDVYPRASVDLCTPNQYELLAMWEAAKTHGYLDAHPWFEVVDSFGIMRGARERFVSITSAEMADKGIPVQSVNLLPYIPTIITKLGANGALLTTLLGRDDPRLRDPDHARYVVSRCHNDHPHVGGVYMRLFPAVERVKDVVSVNGIGDTFMGVLIAGLAMGGKVENLIDVAQRAAVLTLRNPLAMPMHNGFLPREGFKSDTVLKIIRNTALNPKITLPLLLLAKYTKKGQDWSILHPTAFRRLKGLLVFGVLRLLNSYFSRRVLNNWVDDKYDWSREIVVITGGSGGIGGQVVQLLAERGIKVVVLDIQPLAYPTGPNVYFFKCDITSPKTLSLIAREIRLTVGEPTILINNAGVVQGRSLLDASERDVRFTFDVNTFAHYWTTQEFLPYMIRNNHGMVVTVASVASWVTVPNMVDYAASKAAALSFHQGLTAELATLYKAPRVRTVMVNQGYTKTALFTGYHNDSPFLMPALHPATVAEAIVRQVLTGESGQLLLPGFANTLPVLAGMPHWYQNRLRAKNVKIMENFRGRKVVEDVDKFYEEREKAEGADAGASTVLVEK